MKRPDRRLQRLALLAHGALAALHSLGAAYHLLSPKRTSRSYMYASVHIAAALFDLAAAPRHR